MGSSESKASVKNVNNTLIVNQTSIDLLNEQSTAMIANTIIEHAKSSTASIVQSQNMSFTKLHAKGDISISGVSQKQQAAVTFKNLNVTNTTNDISNNLLTSMINNIKSSVNNDVLNKMMANAESSTKTSALSMPGWASSRSDTLNESNATVKNTTDYKLKNIVSNTIQNNFTTKNVENCIASVTGNQYILVSDLVSTDGSIKLSSFSQEQAATLMAECVSQSGVANKIISTLQNTFGITIEDDKKTASTTEQTGTAKATTEAKGLLDIFPEFSEWYIVMSVVSSSICCLLIVSIVVLFLFLKMRS
jgi:hypothetical protein